MTMASDFGRGIADVGAAACEGWPGVTAAGAGAAAGAGKRAAGRGAGAGAMVCGAITLDAAARVCTVSGEAVKLSPREFELLRCLMRNRGRVLSREQLLDKVWGLDFEGGDRAVDARIRGLRAALGQAGGQIKTVFKSGYRLEEV